MAGKAELGVEGKTRLGPVYWVVRVCAACLLYELLLVPKRLEVMFCLWLCVGQGPSTTPRVLPPLVHPILMEAPKRKEG